MLCSYSYMDLEMYEEAVRDYERIWRKDRTRGMSKSGKHVINTMAWK